MTILADIGFDLPPDGWFVIAAYVVIIGGLALYTALLWRRLRMVRGRDDEAR